MACQVPTLSNRLLYFKKRVTTELDLLIPDQDTPYHKLFEATRYSLLAPGKRLRGSLVLAAVESLGGSIDHALWPACAIEMVHAYSLIHDDLPCMDNDDLRRGRPTLHKAYPEWLALLSGDYLLTKAFETLSQAPYLCNTTKISLVSLLASRSGAHGMIGGQVLDILQENIETPFALVELTHRLKTAALIEASCEFAGLICGLSKEDNMLLKGYGQKIGLAFQIIDDILDVQGDFEHLGKSPGSDELKDKNTYVTQLGVEGSRTTANRLIDKAIEDINLLNPKSDLLKEIASYFIERIG